MTETHNRVLVGGGREFSDVEFVEKALNLIAPDLVITGGCRGADMLAQDWAERHGVPCMVFPAPWASKGRSAGPIRNRWMIEIGKPDRIVAFPGGRGTDNLIRLSAQYKIPLTSCCSDPEATEAR